MLKDKSIRKPVYIHVKNKIQEIIETEGLGSGDFLPSVRELAAKFGTTTVTVSRATRELAYEGKLMRIPRKGIVVSPQLAKQVNKKSWALILPSSGYSSPRFVSAIRHESLERGLSVEIISSTSEPERERKHILNAVEAGVAAVMLLPICPDSSTVIKQPLGYLADLPIPVVVMDYWEPERAVSGIDFVLSDNFAGGYQAAVHMIRHGYKKISMIHGPKNSSWLFGERQKGYEIAMADHELDIPDLPKITSDDMDKEDCQSLKAHIENHIEAFVVPDDHLALMLMSRIKEMGLKIPDDIAIIAYGDAPFASISEPALTTMRPNISKIVSKSFELLCKRVESDSNTRYRTVLIRPEIVCRKSCGRNCHL